MLSGMRFDHQINPYLQKRVGYNEIDRERFYLDSRALKLYGVGNIKIYKYLRVTNHSIYYVDLGFHSRFSGGGRRNGGWIWK
jgi:hypothetical protein